MSRKYVPDGRRSRFDESVTFASSHPELLTGDLVMRPRLRFPLTPDEKAAHATWSQRTLGAYGLFALAMIAMSGSNRDAEHAILEAYAEVPIGLQSCARWHEAASDMTALLMPTMRDADLRRIGDAVFRMRRALRNCEMGWFKLACQDYQAVIKSVPRHVNTQPELSLDCATSSSGENVWSRGANRTPSRLDSSQKLSP